MPGIGAAGGVCGVAGGFEVAWARAEVLARARRPHKANFERVCINVLRFSCLKIEPPLQKEAIHRSRVDASDYWRRYFTNAAIPKTIRIATRSQTRTTCRPSSRPYRPSHSSSDVPCRIQATKGRPG